MGHDLGVGLKRVKAPDKSLEENYDFGEPNTDNLDELLGQRMWALKPGCKHLAKINLLQFIQPKAFFIFL